jgi:hypothetical protein
VGKEILQTPSFGLESLKEFSVRRARTGTLVHLVALMVKNFVYVFPFKRSQVQIQRG